MWLHCLFVLALVALTAMADGSIPHLHVNIRMEALTGVSAGIHHFSQIDLLNKVSLRVEVYYGMLSIEERGVQGPGSAIQVS